MEVSGWFGGRSKGSRDPAEGTFGIRVGMANRQRHFDPAWTEIEVEMDGRCEVFCLTPGFWRGCPEFRDRGTPRIREWLQRYRSLTWDRGRPPRMSLIPLGDNRFRLQA
jgi:hypothetical protein